MNVFICKFLGDPVRANIQANLRGMIQTSFYINFSWVPSKRLKEIKNWKLLKCTVFKHFQCFWADRSTCNEISINLMLNPTMIQNTLACLSWFKLVSLQKIAVCMRLWSILFDLILYITSTIFQLCRDSSCWVEPLLSLDLCVLLKDTTQWRGWCSNPRPSVTSQALYHWATALPMKYLVNWWSLAIFSCDYDKADTQQTLRDNWIQN